MYARLHSDAPRTYPGLVVGVDGFANYVRDRYPNEDDVDALLKNPADLCLAYGCVVNERTALRLFEQKFVPAMRTVIAQVTGSRVALDDVVQLVREKLLVARTGEYPKIADYEGRGPLVTWLRVVAVRTAISYMRKKRIEIPDEDTLFEAADMNADPEVALLKDRARQDIKEAFHDAMAELTARQRNLLRQHLLDGLSIDQLGVLYDVHRVTAARWLTKARSELWMHTKRRLRVRLDFSSQQIDSLLGFVRSTLDLSIERALA